MVFFWCRHCSLLSDVRVESPYPCLLCGWEYCCYSKIGPREEWSHALPSYNCNFLIVFMIYFILPGKVLTPFWPSRTYLSLFFGLMVPQTAGVGWQNIYFAHRPVSQLCGFLHQGRLDNLSAIWYQGGYSWTFLDTYISKHWEKYPYFSLCLAQV